jgi:hypothetical protein
MCIARYLNKQREGFIGLHDLITRLSEANNSNYEQVAAALLGLLADESLHPPDFLYCPKNDPKQLVTRDQHRQAIQMLRDAAQHGDPSFLDIPF